MKNYLTTGEKYDTVCVNDGNKCKEARMKQVFYLNQYSNGDTLLSTRENSMVGVMRGETQVPNKLHMTDQEVSHVMKSLSKRSAADCVLTRTKTGFQCKEMATGKVFKVNGK